MTRIVATRANFWRLVSGFPAGGDEEAYRLEELRSIQIVSKWHSMFLNRGSIVSNYNSGRHPNEFVIRFP